MDKFVLIFFTITVGLIYTTNATTPNIQEIIIGRCLDYTKVKYKNNERPFSVNVNCTELWNVFKSSVAFKNDCDINQQTYTNLFNILNNNERVPDKLLFWTGTYPYTKKITKVSDKYIAVADTFPGYIFDSLEWCSSKEDPGFHQGKCPYSCNPSTPFWAQASENFAKIAEGTVYLMLNGNFSTPYKNTSFFALHELPMLKNNSGVKEIIIYIIHDFTTTHFELSNCESENIKKLKNDARPIQVKCFDNPPDLLFMLCAGNPNNPKCVELLKPKVTGATGEEEACKKTDFHGGSKIRKFCTGCMGQVQKWKTRAQQAVHGLLPKKT